MSVVDSIAWLPNSVCVLSQSLKLDSLSRVKSFYPTVIIEIAARQAVPVSQMEGTDYIQSVICGSLVILFLKPVWFIRLREVNILCRQESSKSKTRFDLIIFKSYT